MVQVPSQDDTPLVNCRDSSQQLLQAAYHLSGKENWAL
jgi:hypothetical protein